MGELETFLSRMKALRESSNMTQKSFSEYIGIRQQTLSGYERGIIKPSLDIVLEIARKCDVSIDWLCGLTDKKNYKDDFLNYSDIIKLLITLEKYLDISINEERLKKGVYYKTGIIALYSIQFNNKMSMEFLADWKKMKSLHDDGSIDDDVYALWIEKTMIKYRDVPIRGLGWNDEDIINDENF